MCATFSDEDVGKFVERADGKVIGTVESLEGGRARVEPAPDVIDSIMARFGWAEIGDPFTLDEDAVDEITENRILLAEGFSASGRERTTGTETGGEPPESHRDNPQNRPDR